MKDSESRTLYTVRQIETPSPAQFTQAVEETTRAFAGDSTLDFIFRSSKEMAQLVDINLRYYLKMGKVFGAFDENGVMQGVSLWNEPGGEPITVKSVLMSGLLGNFCKLFFHVKPGSFYRMLKISDCLQKHHPDGEHMYLYWITAFRPGAGSALLEDAIARFHGFDIYLENSNPDKNDQFYRKHGFERLPEISWQNCVLQPMLRTMKTEREVNIMDNFKDLKKEEYAFNDEELNDVVGGMKTFSVLSTDTSKSTAVLGNGDVGTNAYRCSICNSPEIMDHEAFFTHIKTFHPEEYHDIS